MEREQLKLYRVAQIKHHGKDLYMCPYCKWVFWGRGYIINHMKHKCPASPQAAGCATCSRKEHDAEGDWICGEGQIDGKLFTGPGTATTGCCRHDLDEGDTGLCYYTEKLTVGAEIEPKGYYKTYLVMEIEGGGDYGD